MGPAKHCTDSAERRRNIKAVWRAALAEHVGPGRTYDVAGIAAHTSRTPGTILRHLRGEGCPEWDTAIQIMGLLPVEFAAAVLRPARLTGMRRVDGDITAGEAMRDIAQAAAAMATALADLRIDHTEWPDVRRDLFEAQVAIAQFLADGDATYGDGNRRERP